MEIFNVPIDVNRKDSRLHGSYEFPIAIYDTKFEDLLYGFINWHWHEEMHFYVVKTGSVAVHVNSAVYHLSEGEGVFVNCGCLHMLKPHEYGENAIITLFIHPKLFSFFPGSVIERKYVKPFIEGNGFSSVPLTGSDLWQSEVLDRLRNIYTISASCYQGYELDIVLEWVTIWRSMITSGLVDEVNEEVGVCTDYHRMKTILGYVHDHYADKITLADLAATVNLSRNECCRSFKRSANCSPFEYILDYRIKKGSELLRSGDKSVKEVAYEVGFRDVGYFITSFKSRTGHTPKEYRRKMLAESIQK